MELQPEGVTSPRPPKAALPGEDGVHLLPSQTRAGDSLCLAHCSAICFLVAQEIQLCTREDLPFYSHTPATAGVDASTECIYQRCQQQTPEFSKLSSLQDLGLDVMPSKRSRKQFATVQANSFSPDLVSCQSYLLRLSSPVGISPVCLWLLLSCTWQCRLEKSPPAMALFLASPQHALGRQI